MGDHFHVEVKSSHVRAPRGKKARETHVDAQIAGIAAQQHGNITRAQLLGLGLTATGIAYRVRIGRLRRVHRGVYAIGELTPLGFDMAAVLACGPGAVLSSFNAAVLWGLLNRWDQPRHVTTPRHTRAPDGVIVHQADLPRKDVTARNDIPVTTTTRTLLDLAAHATRPGVHAQ